MKSLYLCGGINGLTDSQCNDWRRRVVTGLAGLYTFIDPMRRDYRGKEDESVNDIVYGDLADIDASDFLIANAERPSWGTGMEIFYAFRKGKTVITVCPVERVSPWLRYHSSRIESSLEVAIEVLANSASMVNGG